MGDLKQKVFLGKVEVRSFVTVLNTIALKAGTGIEKTGECTASKCGCSIFNQCF